MEIDEEEQLLRREIARLERLKALQSQMQQLQIEIREITSNRGRRISDGEHSTSSNNKEVRVKNIETLEYQYTIQKRDDWISNIQRAFDGAPKRFSSERARIVFALDHMDRECRARWDRHLEELDEEDRTSRKREWAYFRDWSLILLRDSANRDIILAERLERAKQREGQDPTEFHIYLDSLEEQFPRQEEKRRAQIYLVKLLPELRRHLALQGAIPEKRETLVDLAMRYWTTLGMQKRKRKEDTEKGPSANTKRKRNNYEDYPSNRPGSSPKKDRKSERRQGSKKPRYTGNPKGKDGKLLSCYQCGSTEHLRPRCPDIPRNTGPTLGKVTGPA